MIHMLQPKDVLEGSYERFYATKTSGTWIKKLLTQEDVDSVDETSFFDLEGREHQVVIGRCICRGVNGERWSSSLASVERDRYAVGEPDAQGYQLHYMVRPNPVLCFAIPHRFGLIGEKGIWLCKERGFITWNGKQGKELDMRVIEYDIFESTYTRS